MDRIEINNAVISNLKCSRVKHSAPTPSTAHGLALLPQEVDLSNKRALAIQSTEAGASSRAVLRWFVSPPLGSPKRGCAHAS